MSDSSGEIDGTFYFAGLGFTTLQLFLPAPGGIGASAYLSNQSFSQHGSDISYDSATGQLSFAVAENPGLVRDILFTGHVITDGSGAVGFSGTWTGRLVTVTRTEEAARPVRPPPGVLPAEGLWAAVLEPQMN
jgi:hypothetical protein